MTRARYVKKEHRLYRQEPPFALQVELTEGCNLRCDFCGLNGIRGKDNDYKFMTVGLASRVARLVAEARWNCRIEFAMHGEPSMNPDLVEILRRFRETLPNLQLMVTSNGGGFLSNPTEMIDAVLEHANALALDWYENVKIVPKILERYKGRFKDKIIYYPQNKDGNPHRRRRVSEHDFIIVQDISKATTGTHSSLNNHAGCGAPKNNRQVGKRCAKPFREMSIRWDGNVAICCNDWRGELKCGSVVNHSLDEVWNNDVFAAARNKLYHGERTFGPCQGCDATSYRVGLLPDKLGKVELPHASKEDEAVLRRALGGGPYTLPVLRSWEGGGCTAKPT